MSSAQTMKIYSIISRIEQELEESPRTKFAGATNKRIVEIDRLFDLLSDLKVTIPEDIRRATGIIAEADNTIRDAKENALRNHIENAEFFCGDAADIAAKLESDGLRPDVVTVDPPRKGLAPEVIASVAAMGPEKVVYVSCDPATLGRDVKIFREFGYEAKRAAAVDMFPGTAHVETVVLLSKVQK